MSAPDRDPFALARADDAELIEAERRLLAIMLRWDDGPADDAAADELSHAQYREIEFINNTPPATLLGAAIKLRVIAHRDYGIEAGEREDDFISLRQVLALIERETA